MNRLMLFAATVTTLGAGKLVHEFVLDPPVNLQSSTPGTAQIGHINVSGKVVASNIVAQSSAATAKVVSGWATSPTGFVFGGDFRSSSTDGRGVFGSATATSGFTFGGDFRSASVNGRGVFGYASDLTGPTVGGEFRTDSPSGTSVIGKAYASSGSPVGIYGESVSASGFAGFFRGRLKTTGEAFFDANVTALKFSGDGTALTNVRPSGIAGGDLSGNYPSPFIGANRVSSGKLLSDNASMFKVSGGHVVVDTAGRVGVNSGSTGLVRQFTAGSYSLRFGAAERAVMMDDGFGNARVNLYDVNDMKKVELGSIMTTPNIGSYLFLDDGVGSPQVGMNVDGAGSGYVFADVKSFRVPNPNDVKTDIWYASIEGPEAAAYLRGTARLNNGRAFIPFPEHFKSIATLDGMTVQLTPRSAESNGLAVISQTVDGVTVCELQKGKGTYDFDWRVEAVRKGHEDFQVLRPWDEDVNASDRERRWKARLKSIEMKRQNSSTSAASPNLR